MSLTAGQTLALGHPAICLMFALGFVSIWSHGRQRRYLLVYAAVFFVCGIGSALRVLSQDDANWEEVVLSSRWVLIQLGLIVLAVVVGIAMAATTLLDIITPLRFERNTDPLTGLLNRRNFEELNRDGLRLDAPYSLVLLDLDNLKPINDTYGHTAGDTVLVELGRAVRSCCRGGDLAWRLGGDEFALLMPRTTASQARQVAELLRTRLAQTPMRLAHDSVRVTASFGIAEALPEETLRGLFVRTDQLLYAAKRRGRNRIVCGQDEADPADNGHGRAHRQLMML